MNSAFPLISYTIFISGKSIYQLRHALKSQTVNILNSVLHNSTDLIFEPLTHSYRSELRCNHTIRCKRGRAPLESGSSQCLVLRGVGVNVKGRALYIGNIILFII